jgi:hypothetical protein
MKAPPMSAERFLAEAARKRILSVVPDATERVRPGWKLIGYNAPAYFVYIAPQVDHLRIGFEWGILLSAPRGLLEGSGSQVRHVSIHAAKELRNPALADLLRAAAALRPPRGDRSVS